MPFNSDIHDLSKYYLYFTLLVSGAVVLVIEIAGVRVLAPFYGSTIYVWSSLITITLAFLSLGYYIGGVIADTYPKRKILFFILFSSGFFQLVLFKISRPVLVLSESFGYMWGALVSSLILFGLPLFLLSMAGPFAIRLLSRLIERTGHVTGFVFAISTVGSLIGALITGFYLIPNYFISEIFLIATVIIMIISIIGLVFEKSSLIVIFFMFLLIILIIIFPSVSTDTSKANVIHREPSFYGEIQVVEVDKYRCLVVSILTQTCIYKKDNKQYLTYGYLIEAILKHKEFESGKLLIVGLGGGILARDLKNKFSSVDIVEIDPKMVKIAEEYFEFDSNNPKINIYVEDGRMFIQNSAKKYDVIIMDAFSGESPATHLYTREVFNVIKSHLSSTGLLLVNSVGRPFGNGELLQHSIYKTISKVFPFYRAISTKDIKKDRNAYGNIIHVASLTDHRFFIQNKYFVPFNNNNTSEGKLLTDSYNPMEIMALPLFGDIRTYHVKFMGNL